MNKLRIAKDSYWVGKVDDRKVPFHRLTLEKGTTYNAYLLETEKPTLIDTVDISFAGEFVKDLASVIDLDRLSYVVVNHVEPDHAGAVGALMNKARNAVIVTTAKGQEFLQGMFKVSENRFQVIQDGETLDIGGKTLQFFETPFLHTEETMITYDRDEKVLYPCDIFSTHVATPELFDDLAPKSMLEDFTVYYQLIMHPHRPYVQRMLDKIKNIPIKVIAPSHGYILRKNPAANLQLYHELSTIDSSLKNKKALLLVSTMTGRTTQIAENLASGLEDMGVKTKIANVKNTRLEEILDLSKEADAILVGTSTRYGDMIGSLENILKELIKLDLSNKLGAAFGSYGWSGEGIEVVNDYLKGSNLRLVDSSYLIKATGSDKIAFPLRIQFAPEDRTKELSSEAGRVLGELLISTS